MNYRHAYHAGNFADVFKHLVLMRIVEYLKRKDKAFRVIDTHAGAGRYDLSGAEAARTGEWQGGIARLMEAEPPPEIDPLVEPLRNIVRAMNEGEGLSVYPGSPLIVRRLLRRQDRLTAIELEPNAAARLKAIFAGDIQVRTIELDGWLALGAHMPPKENRGLVLVDPPFEQPNEFDRMVAGLVKAHRRWPGGTYALWYPVKDRAAVGRFRTALAATAIPRILDVRISVRAPSREPRLDGCGMIIVNPPFTLAEELGLVLPWLSGRLADAPGHGFAIETIAGESVSA